MTAKPGLHTRLTDLNLSCISEDVIPLFEASFSDIDIEDTLKRHKLRQVFQIYAPNKSVPTFSENICFFTSQIAQAGFKLAISESKILHLLKLWQTSVANEAPEYSAEILIALDFVDLAGALAPFLEDVPYLGPAAKASATLAPFTPPLRAYLKSKKK